MLRRLALAGTLGLFVCLGVPSVCRADDANGIAATIARADSVQTKLPGSAPITARPRERQVNLSWLGPVWAIPALVAVAAALIFVLSLLPRFSAGSAARYASSANDGEHDAAAPATTGAIATAADELAAAGRYTEAMHQLLDDTLRLLRRRIRERIPDALTSRELLRAINVHERERDALQQMVARVEETWFARRLALVEDFQAMRVSFDIFAAGFGKKA